MFCPNCGKQIPDGSKFCPYCGTSLEGLVKKEEPAQIGKRAGKKSKTLPLILVPVIAIVAVSLVILYLNFFPKVSPKKSTEYESKGKAVISEIVKSNAITDQNKLSEVQNYFDKAVKLNPDNVSAKKELVYTYLVSDKLEDAQKEIEGILKQDPTNAFALKMKELLSEETP